jgi:hypothetical protein
LHSAVWHKGMLRLLNCKKLIFFAYISTDYRLWPHMICSPILPGSLCPWTLLPSPISLPLLSCPSLHGSHNDVSVQLCSVGNGCLAQGGRSAATRHVVLFCPRPHLLIVYRVDVKYALRNFRSEFPTPKARKKVICKLYTGYI